MLGLFRGPQAQKEPQKVSLCKVSFISYPATEGEIYESRKGVSFTYDDVKQITENLNHVDRFPYRVIYWWQQKGLEGSWFRDRIKFNDLSSRFEIKTMSLGQLRPRVWEDKHGNCYWTYKECAEWAEHLNEHEPKFIFWVDKTNYKREV